MMNQQCSLQYGLIGNGRICALVSARGSIDYLCMPSFDSPFVFDRLLDEAQGGYFLIEPTPSTPYTIEQRYERNSNVLLTRYTSELASFVIHDFAPRWEIWDGNRSHTPPRLCRYLEILNGEPEVVIHFHPRSGYQPEHAVCRILTPTTIQITVFSDFGCCHYYPFTRWHESGCKRVLCRQSGL